MAIRFQAHIELHVGSIDEDWNEQGIAHMIMIIMIIIVMNIIPIIVLINDKGYYYYYY